MTRFPPVSVPVVRLPSDAKPTWPGPLTLPTLIEVPDDMPTEKLSDGICGPRRDVAEHERAVGPATDGGANDDVAAGQGPMAFDVQRIGVDIAKAHVAVGTEVRCPHGRQVAECKRSGGLGGDVAVGVDVASRDIGAVEVHVVTADALGDGKVGRHIAGDDIAHGNVGCAAVDGDRAAGGEVTGGDSGHRLQVDVAAARKHVAGRDCTAGAAERCAAESGDKANVEVAIAAEIDVATNDVARPECSCRGCRNVAGGGQIAGADVGAGERQIGKGRKLPGLDITGGKVASGIERHRPADTDVGGRDVAVGLNVDSPADAQVIAGEITRSIGIQVTADADTAKADVIAGQCQIIPDAEVAGGDVGTSVQGQAGAVEHRTVADDVAAGVDGQPVARRRQVGQIIIAVDAECHRRDVERPVELHVGAVEVESLAVKPRCHSYRR